MIFNVNNYMYEKIKLLSLLTTALLPTHCCYLIDNCSDHAITHELTAFHSCLERLVKVPLVSKHKLDKKVDLQNFEQGTKQSSKK